MPWLHLRAAEALTGSASVCLTLKRGRSREAKPAQSPLMVRHHISINYFLVFSASLHTFKMSTGAPTGAPPTVWLAILLVNESPSWIILCVSPQLTCSLNRVSAKIAAGTRCFHLMEKLKTALEPSGCLIEKPHMISSVASHTSAEHRAVPGNQYQLNPTIQLFSQPSNYLHSRLLRTIKSSQSMLIAQNDYCVRFWYLMFWYYRIPRTYCKWKANSDNFQTNER